MGVKLRGAGTCKSKDTALCVDRSGNRGGRGSLGELRREAGQPPCRAGCEKKVKVKLGEKENLSYFIKLKGQHAASKISTLGFRLCSHWNRSLGFSPESSGVQGVSCLLQLCTWAPDTPARQQWFPMMCQPNQHHSASNPDWCREEPTPS